MSFSYGRAPVRPKGVGGKDENIAAAQEALLVRAKAKEEAAGGTLEALEVPLQTSPLMSKTTVPRTTVP